MKLRVVLEPSDEGGFTAHVPALPGCISEGESEEEALANIREAVILCLEEVEDDVVGREDVEVRELVLRRSSPRWTITGSWPRYSERAGW
jgi:predicted RNase H-like HicB family nuclease